MCRLGKAAKQAEALNYSEVYIVNVADGWRGRLRSYLGRSRRHSQCHKTFVVMVEIRFIMRSQLFNA